MIFTAIYHDEPNMVLIEHGASVDFMYDEKTDVLDWAKAHAKPEMRALLTQALGRERAAKQRQN